MIRKAVLGTAAAALLVTSALHTSALQAQTLDQTLSGCNGAAP